MWRVSQIYWAVVLYSGIWIGLRASGIGGTPLPPVARWTLVMLFAIGTAHLFLRSTLTVRRGGYGMDHVSRMTWLHTAVDLLLVAAVVRVTGGAASGIWLLYVVIIVAESVLESAREARWVRFGVAASLFVAVVPVPLVGGAWILDYVTRLVFLMAASLVVQRLRINAEREKAEAASLRAEVALLEERSHLSREIHDGIGNALAAAVLRLEVTARIAAKTRPADTETPTLLQEEAQVLRGAMNDVRDWTFFNKPWSGANDEIGAGERLSVEVERLSRRTHTPMRVVGAEVLDGLRGGAVVRLAVLRIVQEALTNVAKYATGATEAVVTLEKGDAYLRLSVTDNGVGFDAANVSPGVGLSSMRERAAGLGGTFSVESVAGQGTAVTARLPLP